MLESESGVAELFRETRDQLLIVLRHISPSGAIARGLVEDPERAEGVFEMPLKALLEQVYGSASQGLHLAASSLIANGHFVEAEVLLTSDELCDDERANVSRLFAQGMARYYAGEPQAALDALSRWIASGAPGDAEWRERAGRALDALASDGGVVEPALVVSAQELGASLKRLASA